MRCAIKVLKVLFSAWTFLSLFHVCTSLSCTSQTLYTCSPTLHVTTSCNQDTGQCGCKTGYSPVVTGCAASSDLTLNKAIITANGFSGWIYSNGAGSLSLFCSTGTTLTVNAYTWYRDDEIITGEYGRSLVLSNIPDQTEWVFRCAVTEGVVMFSQSDPFTVRTYKEGDIIGGKPVVVGMPKRHFNGATRPISCSNYPYDTDLSFTWKDSDVKTKSLTVSFVTDPVISQCGIVIGRTQQVTHEYSDPVTSTPIDPNNLDLSVAIMEGPTLTIVKGRSYKLTCQLSDIVAFPDSEDARSYLEYTWKKSGQDAPACSSCRSSDPEVYVINIALFEATETPQDYTCVVNVKGYTSQVESAPIVVTIVDPQLKAVSVKNVFSFAPTNGYTQLRCLVVADTLQGITYSWMYNDVTIPGQTDSTLQINNLSSDVHGAYSCTASLNGMSLTSTASRVSSSDTVLPPGIDPFIAAYTVGKSYQIECFSTSHGPGMTIQWIRDGAVVQSSNYLSVYSFTGPTSNTQFTCEATFQSLTNQVTWDINVQYTSKPVIKGPSKPVVGATNVVYTCDAEISPVASPVAYKWYSGDNEIAGKNSLTLTLDIIYESVGETYICEVTAGSEVKKSDPLYLKRSIVETSATPRVVSTTNTFQNGGSYTLSCQSDSWLDGVPVQWNFRPDGGSKRILSETGAELKIGPASSSDAGEYSCKITVAGKDSAESYVQKISYNGKQGKLCTSTSVCTRGSRFWFFFYTGNCVNGVCECMPGVALSVDRCDDSLSFDVVDTTPNPEGSNTTSCCELDSTTDGAQATGVSVLTLFLALLLFPCVILRVRA